MTTSDDKSVRVWEWDIPVDFKYIADPGMHSMPAVTKSPDEKFLAATSLDNKVKFYFRTKMGIQVKLIFRSVFLTVPTESFARRRKKNLKGT